MASGASMRLIGARTMDNVIVVRGGIEGFPVPTIEEFEDNGVLFCRDAVEALTKARPPVGIPVGSLYQKISSLDMSDRSSVMLVDENHKRVPQPELLTVEKYQRYTYPGLGHGPKGNLL